MGKKLITSITMLLLVVSIIVLSYFLNIEQKQNQQYESYLSQHIGNEIGQMYSTLKENKEVSDEIMTTKTITKDQIERVNFNYHRIIKNYVEMQQLATSLSLDFGNENRQNYSFYSSIIDIGEYFLKNIDTKRLKDRYSISLNDNDIKKIKAIQSLHEDWLPLMAEYKNVKGKTVKENYWIDFWDKLDEVTNENQHLKDIIR